MHLGQPRLGVRSQWFKQSSPRVEPVPSDGVVERRPVLACPWYIEVEITSKIAAELARVMIETISLIHEFLEMGQSYGLRLERF